MTLDELNDLDFSNIGDWPWIVKILLILILCALLGIGWYYLSTQDQLKVLDRVKAEEQDLRADFEEKQQKGANLEAYKAQLKDIEERFGTLLRQLPNRTEVADLLVDVSQTGLASGLEFELFKPVAEVPKDFYAELPIKIKVIGNYHEFGAFVSGLASLPRIVTVHNVSLAPARSGGRGNNSPASNGGPPKLTMEMTAKTYRYLDEEAQ